MLPSDTISVLICVHSTSDKYDTLLARALTSLENQTYKDFETVIVLDACHANTQCVITKYRHDLNLSVYIKETLNGLSNTKNLGLNHIKSDYVAFLDADDFYHEAKLDLQRDFLIERPEIDICATGAYDVYQDGRIIPNCFGFGDYMTDEQIKARLPLENILCHGSILLRKSILDNIGGYRNIKGMEDWDCWQRLAANNHTFFKLPNRLYYYSMNTGINR